MKLGGAAQLRDQVDMSIPAVVIRIPNLVDCTPVKVQGLAARKATEKRRKAMDALFASVGEHGSDYEDS